MQEEAEQNRCFTKEHLLKNALEKLECFSRTKERSYLQQ